MYARVCLDITGGWECTMLASSMISSAKTQPYRIIGHCELQSTSRSWLSFF